MKFNTLFMLFVAFFMSALGVLAQDSSTEFKEIRYYLVDCSGSMTWTFDTKTPNNRDTFSKLDTLKRQLIDECKGSAGVEGALHDGVHVELVQFVDDIKARDSFELTSDAEREALIKAIQNIKPYVREDKTSPTGRASEKTHVWSVLEEIYKEAFEKMEEDESARISVTVVSDGEDESGVPTEQALAFLTDASVKEKLRNLRKNGRGIRPVLIALSWNVNDYVKQTIEDVGGLVVEADNPKDVLFPVEAIMTIVPPEVEVGESVYITSLSDGSIKSTAFDIEGKTFRQKQVTRVFDEPGNYEVVLTVQDRNGDPHTDKGVIVVKPSSLKAQFVVSNAQVVFGESVIFNNESTGAVERCEWEFSDGTTSNKKNPTVRFDRPGKYSATLTVVDKNGRTDLYELKDAVEVTPPPKPVADFNGPDKVTVGDPNVTFVSASQNAEKFTWKLDGKIIGRDEHLRYVFKTTDISAKTLTLEVTSPYGDKTSVGKEIAIVERKLDFVAVPETPTIHEAFKLVLKTPSDDESKLTWSLDGKSIDPEQVTIDEPGEYEVVLKVVDRFGETLCSKTIHVIAPDKPIASFELPDSADVDKAFKIVDNSQRTDSVAYLLDGEALESDSASPTVVFNEPGEHTIEQVCANEGGETRLLKTITVKPYDPPRVRINAVSKTVRAGKPIGFVVDVKGDAQKATIDWGDGKQDLLEFSQGPEEDKSWTGEHTYEDKGVFNIVCNAEGRGGKSEDVALEFPVAARRMAPKADFDVEAEFKEGKWFVRLNNKSEGDGPFTYKFSDGSEPVVYEDLRYHQCEFMPGEPVKVTLIVSNGDDIEPVYDSVEKTIPLPTWLQQNSLLLFIGAVLVVIAIAAAIGAFVWYKQGGLNMVFKYRVVGDSEYRSEDLKTCRREKDLVLTVRITDNEDEPSDVIDSTEEKKDGVGVFDPEPEIELVGSAHDSDDWLEDDTLDKESDPFSEKSTDAVDADPFGVASREPAPSVEGKRGPNKPRIEKRKIRISKLGGPDPRYSFTWVDDVKKPQRIGTFKKRELNENSPCESNGVEFCFTIRS